MNRFKYQSSVHSLKIRSFLLMNRVYTRGLWYRVNKRRGFYKGLAVQL